MPAAPAVIYGGTILTTPAALPGSTSVLTVSATGVMGTTDLSGVYQPLDGDLTALAALTGTNTIYYRSGANTWTAVAIGAGLSFSGGTLNCTVTASSGANPTAMVGLTAVNGSASTFMRSDGAPALDQSIAPTWTGSHTFSPATTGTVFNTSNSKPLIVRQSGGVSGTDEARIFHDGADLRIENQDSSGASDIVLSLGGGETTTIARALGLVVAPTSGIAKWILGPSGRIAADIALGWSSNAVVTAAPNDTELRRLAAEVIGITHSIQQPGVRSIITADVTNSTTTLTTTGLSITVKAGRKYASGRILLWLENVTAADGIKIDLGGGTATWTSFRATYKAYDSSGFVGFTTVTAISTALTVSTFTGAGWVEIEYSGVCNAAGTIIPRFAKHSDAAGALLSLRANSFHQCEDYP